MHVRTFFDEDLLDHSAFDRAYLDGHERLDLTAYADIVVEFSVLYFRHGYRVAVDIECAGVIPYEEPSDQDCESGSAPVRECFLGECDLPTGHFF